MLTKNHNHESTQRLIQLRRVRWFEIEGREVEAFLVPPELQDTDVVSPSTVLDVLDVHDDIRLGPGVGAPAVQAVIAVVNILPFPWHQIDAEPADIYINRHILTFGVCASPCGRSARRSATVINPELLTCAERLQYEGFLRREETNAAILALAKDNVPIRQIVCRTGHSRKLVRQIIRGERTEVFRTRQCSIDAQLPFLDAQWASGCHNGAELWRRLKAQGFRGSSRVVSEWATRRRRAEKATDHQLQKVPSARTIARLMTTARDHLI